MRIANTPRTGVNGSPGSVGWRLAPRCVVTGPRTAVMVRPGAKTVVLFDQIFDGTNVTGAVRGSPRSTGRSVGWSPGSRATAVRRSVVTGPGAKVVLFFDEVFDGTSVTGAVRAGTVRRSPGTKTVLFFSQVLDGASVTTTPGRGAPWRRTNSVQTASVVMAPSVASPQANTGFLGGLVLDGTSNAQKTSQNNLIQN